MALPAPPFGYTTMLPQQQQQEMADLAHGHGSGEHGCGESDVAAYDLGWHIAAVFIVLGVALAGTMLPVAGRVHRRYRLNEYVFALLKNFGSGVILATGFVHMFPPANAALTSPCLPPAWAEYASWAGLFALVAALMVQLVQTAAITHFSRRSHNHHHHTHAHDLRGAALEDGLCANQCHEDPQTRPTAASDDTMHVDPCDANTHASSSNDTDPCNTHTHASSSNDTDPCNAHTHASSSSSAETQDVPAGNEAHKRNSQESIQSDLQQVMSRPVELGALTTATNIHQDGCCDVQHAILAGGGHQHRKITAYILEIGIAMHSIIIGIAIGVATGSEFYSLLIAISFHQFFEGVALSSTALDAGFESLVTPLTMAIVYTMTTPLGVSIGIAISSVYNPGSPAALLTQGIFDAISAGILIYDALVNLITANITHNATFAAMSLPKKTGIFIALWLGAGVMALLGRWA